MPTFLVKIFFRDMDHSDAVETNVREKIARLGQFYERIHYIRAVAVKARRDAEISASGFPRR